MKALRAELPWARVYVSTTTLAGRAAADEKLCGLADGVVYAPLDYVFAVRRVLRALRPRAVVILETEIWPNLYREARRLGCVVVVVNGRISDRALPRYRRFAWFFRQILQLPDAILAQTEVSRERFIELGAPAAGVRMIGNLKYDFSPKQAEAPAAIREVLEKARPWEVWIAASTMPPAEPGDPDEDEAVLGAFGEIAARRPGLLLIVVPRKPERFDAAAALLERLGMRYVRRTALRAGDGLALPGVLLLDTIGELSSIFGVADVVFMGGTLARRGGHNILEPAFFGKPVIVGPHMENFPEIAGDFARGGAVVEIGGAGELAGAVERLLGDARLREEIGGRARGLAERARGATARAVAEIGARYAETVVGHRPAAYWLLWPLSRAWLAGGAVKRRWDLARRERLGTPVVGVGGITAGGSGKSPLVLWLARRLERPAILTRGYRRRAGGGMTIVAPGERVPVAVTGDEAQVYVRAGVGPVGIGADRATAGRVIEKRFRPAVFVLDDAFQHYRLHRDMDIVTLDAADPLGGGQALPLGFLRERPEALGRADIVVVTRVAPGQSVAGVERLVRRYNPKAPVFTARVVPRRWVDAATGETATLPDKVGAICGLGRPEAFWQTLRGLGIEPEFRRVFPDHHRYSLRDLRFGGVEAVLTTEKDVMNLPEGWQAALGGLRVLWLDIEVEVAEGEALLGMIKERM